MCPNCERIFFRSADLARTITTCPACQARLTFNKEGKCALIKQVKYAREDPKHVRTYFNELKQHKVPFRTRMQWLSRIYGGRGGYTSEELYKIVTGKTVGGYYIFPFVKGAPPEVNRILERTYRKHREAGATKVAAAIAAWTKVKQAGYVKVTKPAPVWVKRRYDMTQLKPIQVVGYGLGAGMGGLAERGVRGLFGAARRHPRITRGAGAFGVGYLTAKELERRRKRKKGYQLDVSHFTPDLPLQKPSLRTRLGKRFTRKKVAGAGRRLGGTTSMAVKAALIGLIATQILERIGKKRPSMAWLPDVRPDIELSGYEIRDQVIEYASAMPSKMLQTIQTKASAALRRTKRGVERGFLLWLLGFISSEVLGRGISKPQRRHEVTFPEKHQLYVREVRPNEQFVSPVWGYHPVEPREFHPHKVPRVSRRPRGARLKKVAKIGALPLATLLAIRLSRRGQEGYSFRSAASKTLRATKKVGGGLSKGLGLASRVAIPALIVSELWPRKKRPVGPRPVHPPVLSQPYSKGLVAARHAREIAIAKLRVRLSRTRMKQALKLRGKRVQRGMFQLEGGELIQMYPFKSAAQRRWMHWKKPKMAKEWEEETPEGKELPEHVSKHALGRRRILRAVRRSRADQVNAAVRDLREAWRHDPMRRVAGRVALGAGLLTAATAAPFVIRSRRKRLHEHVSKHALSVPWALKRARDLMRLRGARGQGREVVAWARGMAKTLRAAQLKTIDVKRKVELGARAGKWETVADQVGDVIGRGQLEKVGLLAAATAAGAAGGAVGHEVGRKRERERIRKLVG